MAHMGTDDHALRSFDCGERLSTRGAMWTLLDSERGTNCIALRLWRDGAAHPQTLLSPFDRFRHIVSARSPVVVRPVQWLQHLRRISGRNHPAGGLKAAASARIRLLPYQLEPALAVLRHGAMRVLIADAVGLGKTIQAGVLLAELAQASAAVRALILVPAGLRDQWAQELARFFDIAAISADARWIHAACLERPADANPWALPGIYLASQDLVKRPEVLRPLEDVRWDLLVVDEAHACSARTDRRAAAHAVALRADRVLLLTATPHADNPAESAALWSIGRVDATEAPILMFRRSRHSVSTAPVRRSVLLSVRPSADEQRMHDLLEKYTKAVWRESQARGDELARLAAIVLRKRALSSAASLAVSARRRMALLAGQLEPLREQLRLPLGDEDPLEDDVPAAVLGAPGLAHAPRERRWLAAIAETAQRASRGESKLRFLRRLLRRIPEPAIVFTEYRDTLVRLSTMLAAQDRVLLLLHGGMSPPERSRVQRRFNEGGAVLLATDAAAEGLNLHTRCRLVVHYELPWSVSRLEQRAGRVDRLGQERRVHELGLIASNTAERLVLDPLVRRACRARASGEMYGLSAALSESRVADIIIGGVEVAVEAESAPSRQPIETTQVMDLTSEGIAEAERLSDAREALLHTGDEGIERRSVRPPVSSIRCQQTPLAPGLRLLYVISLTSPAGREVHVESLVIRLDIDAVRLVGRSSGRALRDLITPFTGPSHPMVEDEIAAAVHRALDFAVPIHRRVTEGLMQRQQLAARRVRPSAARQLVQAGLFDWRGVGTLRLPMASSPPAPDADPGSETRPSTSVLGVDVTLAGALLVTR